MPDASCLPTSPVFLHRADTPLTHRLHRGQYLAFNREGAPGPHHHRGIQAFKLRSKDDIIQVFERLKNVYKKPHIQVPSQHFSFHSGYHVRFDYSPTLHDSMILDLYPVRHLDVSKYPNSMTSIPELNLNIGLYL